MLLEQQTFAAVTICIWENNEPMSNFSDSSGFGIMGRQNNEESPNLSAPVACGV